HPEPQAPSLQSLTSAARAGSLLPEVAEDGFERLDDLVARRARLGEGDLEVEGLGRRAVGEDVVLRAADLGFLRRVAELLAGGAGALDGDFFNQGGHFLGGILSNYL